MIVVITPDLMASDNVGEEWLHYHTRKKKIFTVLWKPTEDIHFQIEPIQRIDFYKQEFAEAIDRLIAELQRQGFPVVEATPPPTPPRLQGGARTLARVEDILPQPFESVEIPGGNVKLEDDSASGGLKGGGFKILSFTIAKYPITNAQYQVFVDAKDGYTDPGWWGYSDDAKQWRNNHQQSKKPAFRMDNDDNPRANVSWFEAVAFCRWLNQLSRFHKLHCRLNDNGSALPSLIRVGNILGEKDLTAQSVIQRKTMLECKLRLPITRKA